jgi:hypothetical protein
MFLSAERKVSAHRDALDDLIWQLFDFRVRDENYETRHDI